MTENKGVFVTLEQIYNKVSQSRDDIRAIKGQLNEITYLEERTATLEKRFNQATDLNEERLDKIEAKLVQHSVIISFVTVAMTATVTVIVGRIF